MNNDEFGQIGKQLCSSLCINSYDPCGIHDFDPVEFQYTSKIYTIKIKIVENGYREIYLTSFPLIPMFELWDFYLKLEKCIMLFDGRFYVLDSLSFSGEERAEEKYNLYSDELLKRRLSYYHTDRAYCYSDHRFINYSQVLTSDLLKKWIPLLDDINSIHQIVLYHIADTGVTYDIKCAYLIECCEPMIEIVKKYSASALSLPNPKNLKECIESLVTTYGSDIFEKEIKKEIKIKKEKRKFFQVLKNSRVNIMHMKPKQATSRCLSGEESVLYFVKLIHLYRKILFSLLEIDEQKYISQITVSVKRWNQWNGVLDNFLKKLDK